MEKIEKPAVVVEYSSSLANTILDLLDLSISEQWMLPILIKMVFICNLLPFMLGDNLSPVEKVQLQLFHDRAASRLEQIFSAEPHKRQLLNTVGNSSTTTGTSNTFVFDKGVSTITTLFQDILDDMEVNYFR